MNFKVRSIKHNIEQVIILNIKKISDIANISTLVSDRLLNFNTEKCCVLHIGKKTMHTKVTTYPTGPKTQSTH